jgi:hypothetical protein
MVQDGIAPLNSCIAGHEFLHRRTLDLQRARFASDMDELAMAVFKLRNHVRLFAIWQL